MRRFGESGASWRHPQGWQAVVRIFEDRALVVVHTFAGAPDVVAIPLSGEWELTDRFPNSSAEVSDDRLLVKIVGDFSGAVFLLTRR